MPPSQSAVNRVRQVRTALGLTQAELAGRAGISRTAVTAIEGRRLVPSVAAALALAKALGTTAEQLFGSADPQDLAPEWAWEPRTPESPFWQAEVAGRLWRYPAESAPMWTPPPDSAGATDSALASGLPATADRTLVVACCDPAAGLLASEFGRATGQRMLVFTRSSGQALDLQRQGKVHLAGLHYSTDEDPERNARMVRETLGDEYLLLRIAQWQEGIATASSSRIHSIRGALRSTRTWIGREPGSGAQQCLDRLLGKRPAPTRVARSHRGVAEAIASGWAEAGICVQLTGLEAGLQFLSVQREVYELCLPKALLDDPRIRALLAVVRSQQYRRMLRHLPGYDAGETGTLAGVN
ncbi:MAG: helix-turn-helix domain-containing protein [Pirellulaceae bacterium]|nr:helix-turn-helix domain-containing protein [Pirellulaceae bacterium]